MKKGKYRVVIDGDLLMVLDSENNGQDATLLRPDRMLDALEKVVEWAREYQIDAIAAVRILARYEREND